MTVKEILLRELDTAANTPIIIQSHHWEHLKNTLQAQFGITHNAATYERVFRSIKNDLTLLAKHKLKITKIPTGKKYNSWEVSHV